MKAFSKFFFLLLILVPGLLLVSCNDDDDDDSSSCTAQDFVGTYGGTYGGQNITADISIDSDGDLEVNLSSEPFPIYILVPSELDGCKAVSNPQLEPDFNLTLNGDNLSGTLDGSNLNITKGDLPELECAQAEWLGTYTGMCDDRNVTLVITANGATGIQFTIAAVGPGSQTNNFGALTYEGDGCTASYSEADEASYTLVLNGNSIGITTTDGAFNALDDCNNQTTVSK